MEGLKAIAATWRQIEFDPTKIMFDREYVEHLERRIYKAETRIRNGL